MYDLSPAELRVLGSLLEKQRTTPDTYPLTLNGLRAACNQSTNRDPVVQYDEETIRNALHQLGKRRWTRLASGHGSRAAKYRHLLEEELRVSRPEQALLAVLMLRGPQTPGELLQRTERLYHFANSDELQQVMDALIERDMVVRLSRRPGQREERYAQLLGGDAPPEEDEPFVAAPPPADDRIGRIERELADMRAQVDELRSMLTGSGQ
ncbi:MAG TPA: YceH family protein [Solirubrobacteraceae bacterium]